MYDIWLWLGNVSSVTQASLFRWEKLRYKFSFFPVTEPTDLDKDLLTGAVSPTHGRYGEQTSSRGTCKKVHT